MLEKTDLDECKRVAINFLDLDIQISDAILGIVSHPFFQSSFVMDEEAEKIVNILESKKNLENIKKQIIKKINRINNYMEFSMCITTPYRLAFLKYTLEYLNIEDLSKFLIDTWINDEYANLNKSVSKKELVKFFRTASKELLMDEEELQEYSNLGDVVVIYRGVTEYNNKQIKAMSWTLNKDTAKWFANRFNQKGYVYQAKINKKDILAFCDRRNEKELIVDYTKLYDITLI